MTQDLRDSLLNWLAREEFRLKKELSKKSDIPQADFLRGELLAVMNTTAYILMEGTGF